MYKIGVDLGGTNIKAGVLDERGLLVLDKSKPTEVVYGTAHVISNLRSLIQELMEELHLSFAQIRNIGIGSAGIVDAVNGVVLYSNNFGWEDVPLVAELKKTIPCSIYLANDAQCAALGELKEGAAKGCQDIVLLTLGTGVGSGFIVNGRIFEGGHPGGGVLGHNLFDLHGSPCSCGRSGCVETHVSATALIQSAKETAKQHPESALYSMCHGELHKMNAKIVFDASKEQDPYARQIVDTFIAHLSDVIANVINVFRPQKVLISGGICNQGEALTDALNEQIRGKCFAGNKLFVAPVVRAKLGNCAGIVGAAYLDEAFL